MEAAAERSGIKPPNEVIVAASSNLVDLIMLDGVVKSRKIPLFVIPAKAGIQLYQMVTPCLDSGFHRSDDFLRGHNA